MDQRNTLRRMFAAVGVEATDEDMRVEGRRRPGADPGRLRLLFDPTYGVPAITEAKALAPECGLLVAAEPSERRSYPGEPRTHRDPDLNARGCWIWRRCPQVLPPAARRPPGRPRPRASRTWSLRARRLRRSSTIAAAGVPVVIENLVYERPGEDLRARLARMPSSRRPVPSTTWTSTCSSWSIPVRRKAAAARRDPPPALGRPLRRRALRPFTDIMRIAADEGGASGFIAGRSVWREAVALAGPQRQEFLATVALPRLERLIAVANGRARPWTEATRP